MTKYVYNAVVKELLENQIIAALTHYKAISERGVYFYDQDGQQDDLKQVYEGFFQFCQKNLSEFCVEKNYNIEPSKFFYSDDDESNAIAALVNGYYIISINRGVIEGLYSLVTSSDIFYDPTLIEYKIFDDILRKDQGITLQFLLLQYALLYTYYHEQGHLVQYSNKGSQNEQNQEHYRNVHLMQTPFSFLQHIHEYDADMHGSNSVAILLVTRWNGLSEQYRTNENLEKLIVIALAGILGYILILWQGSTEKLYFKESTHPHPTLRIMWNLISLYNTAKGVHPDAHQGELFRAAFRIINVYYTRLGRGNINTDLLEPFQANMTEVMNFYKEIIRRSDAIPYLVINTLHKRPLEEQ